MTQFSSDAEAIDSLVVKYKELSKEISKVIIGQDEVIEKVLIAILSNGHSL